ncbi:cysteine synthase-like protein [Truncatella angustata]|uniref:Cysteine synthase 2 n=1 Tax=Truncatella angustata TaxID=152316 RepID=A0A9P8UTE9_9PEZI|nr:cysteine synthase-like protein [Truncatella angustata]KAH6657879.1 cysteine synthase-like protein [Truncatella angustata]
MSLSSHPKAYGTAAVAVAFVTGVLITLGFKDFYPDLERRYQQSKRRVSRRSSHRNSLASEANTARRRSSFFWGPVELEDHEEGDPKDSHQAQQDQHLLPPSAGPVVGIEGCIGHTPLVEIKSLSDATGRTILAKAEFLNGAGNSPKDRVALSMIQAGEDAGLLVPGRGDTIYEGTVGSTGISIAALARAKGYKAHICMPDDQAKEKSDLLHHLGAIVERVRVAPITSPDHFVNLARRRAKEHTENPGIDSNGFFADQFESGANWLAHYNTTGPEIFYQTGGELSAFVAGAGTGGTISGVAKYLKEEAKLTDLKIVLADPQGSGLYNKIKYGVMYSSTEREGTRRRQQVDTIVEGIGINRVTNNFNAGRDYITDAVKVSDEQACKMARWLVEHDGIFVGSSSAVNCTAAAVAAMKLPEGSRVVTVLCDSGARHLSKFWKKVGEMGLEDQGEKDDLFEFLGISAEQDKTGIHEQ